MHSSGLGWLFFRCPCFRLSNLFCMQAVRDNSDDELSSSDEEEDAPPVLHSRALTHSGGVNRLRAMPQRPGVLAAWADTGAVQACPSQYLFREGQRTKSVLNNRTAAYGRHMPQRLSVLAACADAVRQTRLPAVVLSGR